MSRLGRHGASRTGEHGDRPETPALLHEDDMTDPAIHPDGGGDHERFRGRQRSIVLDDVVHVPVRVAYTDLGEGEPLVLLHGIPTWSFLFADTLSALAEHHRVLAVDLLGHGWSDRRDCFDRSLQTQARMVLRFLDELGIDRATVVGHDTGGGVALILGVEHSERLTALVLTDVVAYDSWPIDDMLALGNPRWADRSPREVVDYVAEGLPDGISRPDRLTEAWATGILAPYADEEGKISLLRNASALNTNHTTALVDRHASIPVPTLVLWGVDDPWQPVADGERLAAEIPGAELVRVDRASHWLPHDAPQE